ncbi:EexN family lipoprotein [Caulobacter sp. NIBR2454]|uniref:EexN family lipoprotein n=1 Tax=Caulobacter sp. NIBR2454 TaxID=3015996 RepID=UPI0022B61948|nr:EexN family lipoprotein [Caulobacter sp. NIBR2454]
MNRLALIVPLFLAACDREPRSASYFIAHPTEADRVMEACEAGKHRGPECENATASRVDRERRARMEFYRRGFETEAP